MSDLALVYKNGTFDLDLGDGGIAIDDGLRTAVIISLFTDRRAEEDDQLPDGTDDRRGWWGDIHPDVEGDLIGSRLWLLSREKQLPQAVRRAETYAKQALQWIVEDGLAQDVTVSAHTRPGLLALEITIVKPRGEVVTYRAPVSTPTLPIEAGDQILDQAFGPILDQSGQALFEQY